MKWRGLPFQGDMVRATRAGDKTETRRVITRAPKGDFWEPMREVLHGGIRWQARLDPPSWHPAKPILCPYGVPGDGLYVREAFHLDAPAENARRWHQDAMGPPNGLAVVYYRATDGHDHPDAGWIWKPSIHMPRWASRQGLILTDVAVERVQDIDEAGALAEGVRVMLGDLSHHDPERPGIAPTDLFADLWDGINGPRGYGWDANPWVWRLRYELTDELPPPLEQK